MIRTLARIATLVLGALGVSATSHATSIGLNFTTGGHLLAPSDEPGIVLGDNWNNLLGGSGGFGNLLDDSGVSTSADATWVATGSYDGFASPSSGNPATVKMYRGGLYGDNAPSSVEVSVTVTDIPFAMYDVIVYASAMSASASPPAPVGITGNGFSYYYFGSSPETVIQTTGTTPGTATGGGFQYQLFADLTASTFNLNTFGSLNNQWSNNVFGLQIVEVLEEMAPVPEPATFGLALSGLGALAARRRRQNRK